MKYQKWGQKTEWQPQECSQEMFAKESKWGTFALTSQTNSVLSSQMQFPKSKENRPQTDTSQQWPKKCFYFGRRAVPIGFYPCSSICTAVLHNTTTRTATTNNISVVVKLRLKWLWCLSIISPCLSSLVKSEMQ